MTARSKGIRVRCGLVLLLAGAAAVPVGCSDGAGTTGAGGTTGAAGSTGASGTTGGGGITGAAGSTGGGGSTGTGGGAGTATGGRGGSGGGAAGTAAGGTGGNAGGAAGANPNGGRGGGAGGTAGTGGRGGAAGGAAGNGGRGGSSSGGQGGASGGGGQGGASGGAGTGGAATTSAYDRAILADGPVAYLAMNKLSGSEPDLTGNGHAGTYRNGAAASASLPNGDVAADFNGNNQYLAIPSSAVFSIPTTGNLTWEVWIRPDVLQFDDDYVNWMGKCERSGSNCEWQGRMYSTQNSEDRCNRISAYVFKSTGGLGSAADWQPVCGLIKANQWVHVVGAYTLSSAPSGCNNTAMYPGSITIWVNGVQWNQSRHGQTGCMSQYSVIPAANNSPVNVGTNAMDSYFPGAIAKVAFYDRLLTGAQVAAHYQAMTGQAPHGSCAADCSF